MPEREMRFGESAGRSIIRTVEEHTRRMINATPPRGRWQGQNCSCPNRKRLRAFLNPTGGSVVIRVISAATGTDDVTIAYDSTDSAAESALNTATGLTFTVTGGWWQFNDLVITGPPNASFELYSNSLTPGTTYARLLSCCG